MTGLTDLAGGLHVHSSYRDGSYRYEEILAAARSAGLHFLLVSDHNTLQALRDGWQGWHDGVLCIVGVEINTKQGHVVAVNLSDCDRLERLPLDTILRRIAEQGGIAFAAHPMGKAKRLFDATSGIWRLWDSPLFAGIEIWCYMHDWIRELRLSNFRRLLREPDAVIRGPEPELLARWDRATQRRRLSAIGALDNHARNLPFHRLTKPIWTILPHEYVFRTVRTHLLIEPLSGEAERDVWAVLAALAQGRGYVSYDLLGDARGFRFVGRRGAEILQMGDEVPAAGEIAFEVRAPRDCQIRLIRDGELVAQQEGSTLSHSLPAGRSGVVRAETYLNGRAWIFSNPIYIRDASRLRNGS